MTDSVEVQEVKILGTDLYLPQPLVLRIIEISIQIMFNFPEQAGISGSFPFVSEHAAN